MFAAWNIIDSLLTNWTEGHQCWESKMMAGELRRRGKDVRLIGHESIRSEDFPDAKVVATFPLYYAESVSQDRTWSYFENFIVHNRSFHKALANADKSLFQDALCLFPNVSERQFLGILRWLEKYDDHARPKTALMFSALHEWSESNPAVAAYRRIWADCPPSLKRGIVFGARTEMSAENFHRILGVRPHVLPSPLGPTQREIDAGLSQVGFQHEPMIVAFVGGARDERGAHLIPDVVKHCAPLGVRFLVQLTEAWKLGLRAGPLKALRERPDVQFHDGALSREDYINWIAHSLVLLPYDHESYRWRSSGVYLEARCLGAPVIVPDGTWMAEEVKALGNGLVFQEYSPAAIAQCIAAAKADLHNLRARAAASANEIRLQNGADRFVDTLENLLG